MTRPFVPVDLQNAGQVFACLGFMEAAEVLCGRTQSEFDWSDPAQARFYLEVEDGSDAFARVLGFLAECEVCGLVPESHSHTLDMEKWRLPTDLVAREQGFAIPPPSAPAMLPARLRRGTDELVVDHWGDATKRDKVKWWGGAGGLPGAVILAKTLELIRGQLLASRIDPFDLAAPLSSSFRLDWRRDYVPSETGFSLNAQPSVTAVGYPIVDLLAVVGLSHGRPHRPASRDKLRYEYFVHGCALPAVLQRAQLGAANPVFPCRSYRIRLGWPGQENKERCITSVTETTACHA